MKQPVQVPEKRLRRARSRAIGMSSVYLLAGSIWIFLSDAALVAMFAVFETQVVLQFVKGLSYVAVTTIIFLILLYRLFVKQEELREQLSVSTQRQDMLLREMHHRIKNNLQFVISMLGIQRNASRSDDVYDALGISQTRTRALAHANSALYRDALSLRSDGQRRITPVLRELVQAYQPFITLAGGVLTADIDLGSEPLDDELLVPVSLGTGEILSLIMQILERAGEARPRFQLSVSRSNDSVVIEFRYPSLGTDERLAADSLELLTALALQASGRLQTPEAGNDRLLLTFRIPSRERV